MAPVFEELSEFYGKRLKFAKVNTENNQDIASQFGISGIPTLLIINKGEVIDRIVGFASKEVLKEKIDTIISKIK
jgi:thioredoxin 1